MDVFFRRRQLKDEKTDSLIHQSGHEIMDAKLCLRDCQAPLPDSGPVHSVMDSDSIPLCVMGKAFTLLPSTEFVETF